MRIGIRGHDISAENIRDLCEKLKELGVDEIQLVVHKSFPSFVYNNRQIENLARIFAEHQIHIAIYGCYIDPLNPDGRARFHEHIRYAQMLGAGAIATESAVGITDLQDNESIYQQLVSVFRCFAEDAKANNVRCAIETVCVRPICSPEKTARFLRDVGNDNLYAILDPVNLVASPDDLNRVRKATEAIELYGHRIIAVHWKDEVVDLKDPVLAFARDNERVTVITEGLSGEKLRSVIDQMK